MKKYAIVKNNLVTNKIVAESKEIAEKLTKLLAIDISTVNPEPSIGWSYDGESFFEPTTEKDSEEE